MAIVKGVGVNDRPGPNMPPSPPNASLKSEGGARFRPDLHLVQLQRRSGSSGGADASGSAGLSHLDGARQHRRPRIVDRTDHGGHRTLLFHDRTHLRAWKPIATRGSRGWARRRNRHRDRARPNCRRASVRLAGLFAPLRTMGGHVPTAIDRSLGRTPSAGSPTLSANRILLPTPPGRIGPGKDERVSF